MNENLILIFKCCREPWQRNSCVNAWLFLCCPHASKQWLLFANLPNLTVKKATGLWLLRPHCQSRVYTLLRGGFDSQLKRLQSVGYSNSALVGVVHALMQKAKGHVHQRSPDLSKQKPVVLPYVRRVTHNLKKVAERSLWHFPPLANLAACAHKFQGSPETRSTPSDLCLVMLG